ncbi:MAG: hypothetical protein ABIQ16_02045 [Polyangiaceae bacterium]
MSARNAAVALLLLGCSSSGSPARVANQAAEGGSAAAGNASGGAGNSPGGAGNSPGGTGNTSGGANSSGGAQNTEGPITYGGAVSCGPSVKGGTPGGSSGVVDEWQNVTPAGINLDSANNNFGVQDVLVDPVRPSDLYTFVCFQGVWKSTDFGVTWGKINKGTNGDKIDSGKPWGEAIDTNRCRDPKTPPTLYSAGSQGGFWTSKDGGVSWAMTNLPEDGKPRPQDGYNVDVDPYNSQHLIVGFHEQTGVAESLDGGSTFRSIKHDPGMDIGSSFYAFFIDTGAPETTAKVWLLISQAGSNAGTWRTTDGGSSWKQVSKNEHNHGQSQIYQRNGVVYMGGVYANEGWGVLRSKDLGATWEHLGSGAAQGVIYGTEKNIYAQNPGASAGLVDQSGSQRAAQPGDTWTTWNLKMSNGPKHAAVTFDGSHYIIVGGNWNAGIWRYVEP